MRCAGNNDAAKGSMEVHPEGCPWGNQILTNKFFIDIADFEYVALYDNLKQQTLLG